ncbi:hypothetical protein [Erythrobacter ani]|uniref:Uncharacterized protein n=1 Tax=Erythrobacter ani TaxID=2827235 RepID=A0ABS6SQC1_9SPHN|nr:hypothetical protein [Erythrobacter ani]MBV7267238.1 hypothetical protein [Erythrobacter ani]
MKFFDRLLTIVVTATLTSVVWIVFGSSLLEMAKDRQDSTEDMVAPGASPPPQPTFVPTAPPIADPDAETDIETRDDPGEMPQVGAPETGQAAQE